VTESDASLQELTRSECLELAADRRIGRLAVAMREGSPLVVPVNYVLDGEVVIFRTAPGSKLTALGERPVSFQVDEIDIAHRTGWSVLIQGVAIEMSAPPVGTEIESWAPGDKDHWVRIIPASITGRRIAVPAWPVDRRAYL
jgi:nitroimidazol reductase NimA-like FMN-containing flavoprotein (pyridoxamine 5'-phosphate oxidase superfamily)